MSDIFLSYARADRPRIIVLVDALGRHGWTVWWDRAILAGKTFDQVIESELAQAKCVIVLWSKHSVDSDWVRSEAEEGRQRGILVPALLDDVKIPLAFRRIQAANLVNWSGELDHAEFKELCRAVLAIVGAETTATPVSKAGGAAATKTAGATTGPEEGTRSLGRVGPVIGKRAEEERLARERAQAERKARKQAEERRKVEAERVRQEADARERAEAEPREQAEAERKAREKAEQERITREKADRGGTARERRPVFYVLVMLGAFGILASLWALGGWAGLVREPSFGSGSGDLAVSLWPFELVFGAICLWKAFHLKGRRNGP